MGATQHFRLTASVLDFQMKVQTARLYSRETHLGGSSTLATCQNPLAPRTFKIMPLPRKKRSLCDHSPEVFCNLSNLQRQLSSSILTNPFEKSTPNI